MNSYVLWTVTFFMSIFIILAEMTSFALAKKRSVDLLHWHGNSFSSSLGPLVTISRIYVLLVYLYQSLPKYLWLLNESFAHLDVAHLLYSHWIQVELPYLISLWILVSIVKNSISKVFWFFATFSWLLNNFL